MDARRLGIASLVVIVSLAWTAAAQAASHRTRFFVVTAPTVELARQVGDAAESYRKQLAQDWLGYELPDWTDICPIYVTPKGGAGGETRFVFRQGQPGDWRMIIQGSPERILDSVLPHEVLHMVFATHFRQGLPRWADEGACTTVEHTSERDKQDRLLYQCLTSDRGIAFNQMFAMREYPKDMLPLYAQGYSLARFLIAVGGKRKYVDFLEEGMRTNNWTAATNKNYGFASLSQLQVQWLAWVRQGGREDLASNFFTQPQQVAAVAATTPAPSHAASDAPASDGLDRVKQIPSSLAARVSVASASATSRASAASPPSVAPTTSGNVRPAGPLRPVVPAVASSNTTGWYARQRDAHRSGTAIDDPGRAVSRPQPVEQAREVVIELNQAAPYAPGSTGAPIYVDGGRQLR